jgi:hypothetical protein
MVKLSSLAGVRGARHRYRIIDELLAVEATSPPAQVHGRDQPPARA